MDYSGQIKQLSWSERSRQWNDNNARFMLFVGLLAPAMTITMWLVIVCRAFSQPLNTTGTIRIILKGVGVGCESTCLEFCSRTAYAFENNQCSIWIGDLLNLQLLGQDDNTPGRLLLGLMMFIILKARRRTSISTESASGSLVIFGYGDLEKATKNFSEKLGKGGFGTAFKGTLPDGSIIAVKKLESINQGEKQFCAEIRFWPSKACRTRVYSRVLTTMRGTVGFLAPEWILGVAITTKADVYSFGMMLLELVSGRRNFEHTSDEESTPFPVWAAQQVSEGNDLLKLLDNRLNGNADLEELCRTCKVAC
ncbi:Detected protein of unknown function [Hibiscus syriacus]|uniref:Protein kinase domain-containing protein n=1 Tax=Hibiscus syriacus TaxID=106335 RepID=A0A6A2WFG0_HIBSY|nr:Detected protein of unknown function [Hibiscus syriacus]